MFDAVDSYRLNEALQWAQEFRWAKKRLLDRIANPVRLNPDNAHPLLGQWLSGLFLEVTRRTPPWGWRMQRDYNCDCVRFMPLWLWLLVEAWRSRYTIVRPLIRLGFFQGPEGGLYQDFRWSWRFWHAEHFIQRRFTPHLWLWWNRLAWWLQRKELEYQRDMPVWT